MPTAVAASGPQPHYVRLAAMGVVVASFALACIAGRLTTYIVLLLALVAIATPSIRTAFALRQRNPIDILMLTAAILPAVSFAITARQPYDLAYVINFAPLALAIPFRWQLDRSSRTDGVVIIAWLSLLGAAIAFAVSVVQVGLLERSRAGPPLMSAFQFADTAVLLGFFALAGLFVPGARERLSLLAGPLLGCAAAVVGGTRGAVLAAPVLAVLAIAVGFAVVRDRRMFLGILAGVAFAAAIALLISLQFGLDRALNAFTDVGLVLSGGEIDGPTRERLVLLSGGWEAFVRAPVFGYGWQHMVQAIEPYIDSSDIKVVRGFRHLHNGLLSLAVSAGIPGIVSFLIVSVAPVVAVFATARNDQFVARLYLALTLCAGYAVFQLTIIMIGFEFHTFQYAFMTMAILSLANGGASRGD